MSDDRARPPCCSAQTCHCSPRRHAHGAHRGPLGTETRAAAQEPTSFGLLSFPFAWIEHEGGGKEAAKIPPAPASPHAWTSIHLSTQHGCPDLCGRSLEMLLPGLAQRGGWSRNHRGSRSPVKGLRAASPPTEAFSLSSPYKQVQAILPHTGDLSGRFLTAAFTLPPSCGHDQD